MFSILAALCHIEFLLRSVRFAILLPCSLPGGGLASLGVCVILLCIAGVPLLWVFLSLRLEFATSCLMGDRFNSGVLFLNVDCSYWVVAAIMFRLVLPWISVSADLGCNHCSSLVGLGPSPLSVPFPILLQVLKGRGFWLTGRFCLCYWPLFCLFGSC